MAVKWLKSGLRSLQFTICTRNGCTNLVHRQLAPDASHLDLGQLDSCLDDALGDVHLDSSSTCSVTLTRLTQSQVFDPANLSPAYRQRTELTNL